MTDAVTITTKEYELLKKIASQAQALNLAVRLQAKAQGINSMTFAVEEAHNDITMLLSDYQDLNDDDGK